MYDIYRDFSKNPLDSAVTVDEAATKMQQFADKIGHEIIVLEIDQIDDGVDAFLSNGVVLSTRKRVTE